MKKFGYIVVVLTLGLLGYGARLWTENQKVCDQAMTQLKSSPAQKFIELIHGDFNNELRSMPELIPFWSELNETDYEFSGDIGKILLTKSKPKFPHSTTGKIRLRVQVIDIVDDRQPSIMFQMSFFDRSTQNKVYELARTYDLTSILY